LAGIEEAKAERKKLLEVMLKNPPKVQYRSTSEPAGLQGCQA
jgi:hypothetical protein